MQRTTRLALEQLEDRCTPSGLGQPWPDPGNLTVSFAPDGTLINGTPSVLFQVLNQAAPTAQWEQVILSAFQSWAVETNVNFGLVADGGEPFGTDGAVQGDPRFGDIRIGMAALPANLVATTSPFSWTGSTWSGDMILNSSYNFGIGVQGAFQGVYDLFTVVQHEAGHALGIPDNTTDPNSVMYANYSGPSSGLDSLDIANIQTLYGARPGNASNNSLAAATALGNAPSDLGFIGSLNSPSDADFYQVVTPLTLMPGKMTIQIDSAGLSLLEPTLTVFNASGNVVATQSASSPFSNDVSVTLRGVWPLSTYYFEVSGASGDDFAVGDYSAQVSFKSALSSIVGVVPSLLQGTVNTVDHLNTSITSATMLTAPFGQTSDQFNYLYQANIAYGGDADYYEFTAPTTASSSGSYALDAIVWQTDPGGLVPAVHLFDANGNPIPIEVLANSGAVYSIQLEDVTPGEQFYVEVAGQTTSGAGSTGGYVYGVMFNEQAETVAPLMASDTLPTASTADTAVVAMNQNGVLYFELQAANGSSSVSSTLTMTVLDDNGNTMASLSADTGAAPQTTAVYLPAGTYSIVYSVVSTTGGDYQPVTYWLSGKILSEPIGPYYSGTNPPPPPSSSSTAPPPANGATNNSASTTFDSSGASVTMSTPDGNTTSLAIPPPDGTTTQSYTTSAGTTTVTLSTDSDGNTTLTLDTPSCNSITDSTTTSGNTTTETMSTSDGIQVTIAMPVTNSAPMYAGPSSQQPPPYEY